MGAKNKVLSAIFLLFLWGLPQLVFCQSSQMVTVTLTQMADFQITSVPDTDAHIALLSLNSDTTYTDGTYSITHNSANLKKVLAQVTGGSTALGIVLKAELQAPGGGAESKGQISLLDGGAIALGAQTLVDKVPAGSYVNLALHYIASADFSATVGNNIFTVTFTIAE